MDSEPDGSDPSKNARNRTKPEQLIATSILYRRHYPTLQSSGFTAVQIFRSN